METACEYKQLIVTGDGTRQKHEAQWVIIYPVYKAVKFLKLAVGLKHTDNPKHHHSFYMFGGQVCVWRWEAIGLPR